MNLNNNKNKKVRTVGGSWHASEGRQGGLKQSQRRESRPTFSFPSDPTQRVLCCTTNVILRRQSCYVLRKKNKSHLCLLNVRTGGVEKPLLVAPVLASAGLACLPLPSPHQPPSSSSSSSSSIYSSSSSSSPLLAASTLSTTAVHWLRIGPHLRQHWSQWKIRLWEEQKNKVLGRAKEKRNNTRIEGPLKPS